MNGGSGIQPTVELATTNGNGFAYPYPVMYGNNGFGGNGIFGGEGIWAILLFAMIFGNGGWGGFGGFGGGGMYEFPWLLTGQAGINANTNNGFDTLHLSNQIEGTRDAIHGISNQICNSTSDVVAAVTNGFYNSEIAAANRQMADMNQNFALSKQFADCCCENRLGIANLNSTILSENCADRAALADSTQRIITNDTNNTRAILDKLCQLELDNVKTQLDAKNDRIADLQREISMKDLQASQIAQNAFISQGFANEVDQLYNRLNNCPVPTTPVYGRTPIFTCPNNNGCGCGFNTTSQFI